MCADNQDHALDLQSMFVRPEYRRRGIGRVLLQTGMQRAAQEERHCYLYASPMGELMYTAAGWQPEFTIDVFGGIKAMTYRHKGGAQTEKAVESLPAVEAVGPETVL